jgi:hypothetical protein
MSSPENKVAAEIAKVKVLWQRWEPYAIGVVCFIVGALADHVLKL